MTVGILESTSDRFINDVVSRLGDIHVEFMNLTGGKMPLQRDYEVVVDRLSFRFPYMKEMVKALSLHGTYVINNPFTASLTNKFIEIHLGGRLGLPFPKTIVLPDKTSADETEGIVSGPSLEQVAAEIGLPCILKPFDGYAWEDVYTVGSVEEMGEIYRSLYSRRILMAQQLIQFKEYFRAFCFDKRDVLFIKWIPRPLAMGQYLHGNPGIPGDTEQRLAEMTVRLNAVLDLDVNVVEWCVDGEGKWWIIDAFNEVPEIIPEALPPDYYDWIVVKFAACIRDKLENGKKNRVPFSET
jgi:hypothetical protein